MLASTINKVPRCFSRISSSSLSPSFSHRGMSGYGHHGDPEASKIETTAVFFTMGVIVLTLGVHAYVNFPRKK